MTNGIKIGMAGVDTGILLIIDPAYLYAEEDWHHIAERMRKVGVAEAILEDLSARTGRDLKNLAVVATRFGGDGNYEVRQSDKEISIKL